MDQKYYNFISHLKKHILHIQSICINSKVADCICLMSLNHLEAIPVDTHVLRIASEHYLPVERKTKSITIKRYNEIGDVFREVYGSFSWLGSNR